MATSSPSESPKRLHPLMELFWCSSSREVGKSVHRRERRMLAVPQTIAMKFQSGLAEDMSPNKALRKGGHERQRDTETACGQGRASSLQKRLTDKNMQERERAQETELEKRGQEKQSLV